MNEIKLRCNNCGNEKEFYRECTLVAKIKINIKDLGNKGKPYDISKQVDNYFDTVFCGKCGQAEYIDYNNK